MIKIIDGDLLSSNADIIIHQVNCQGKMNSGVAKAIREKYPQVYEQYSMLCSVTRPEILLGEIQGVVVDDGQKVIYNCFAQCNYGYDGKQYTNINALKKCLETVAFMASKFETIAMPYKIGCVRGGANWDEVYAIIEEVFKDCNVELWRLDKG